MSVLYEFRCDGCPRDFEAFAPLAVAMALCPACGQVARRRYSVPVTDCKSFGKNVYGARTPQWKWRATSAEQEQQFRDIARREYVQTQFGAGKSTGS